MSENDDGEAINKKLKRESFAGLVNGEVSQWNRYPLQTSRPARASEPSDAPGLYSLHATPNRTLSDPQLPIDPHLYPDGGLFNGDMQVDMPQETIVSSIEPRPEDIMQGIEEDPLIDPQLFATFPQTPAPVANMNYTMTNGVHRSAASPRSAAAESVSPGQMIGLSPSIPRAPKMSATPRKVSHTPQARPPTGKSQTPKSAKSVASGPGRRDSKGAIRLDQQARPLSSSENTEDMASLALALQLQMEEHGLRRRSK